MNPISPKQTQKTSHHQIPEPSPAGVKLRLLVVEDNRDLAMLMEMFLVMKGLQVKLASTAREAYIALNQEDYNLILLDIDLPDGNGFDICRWIRNEPRLARTPVCFCTGRESPETRAIAKELNAHVLFKMFTMDELIAKVEKSLDPGPDGIAPATQ